jgi:hypothetical protein
MKRFVEGLDRGQSTLFPASLDDYVTADNPVRAVDMFVDSLDLDQLGFRGCPAARYWPPQLSSRHYAQTLHLWLP